jgi:hypothetical protein
MFLFRLNREEAPAGGNGPSGEGTPVGVNNTPAGSTPPAYTPPAIAVMEMAPPEYRTKEYLKEVKDVPGLFKRLDELQTKLGQRAPSAVPGADAKPEDVTNFFAGLKPKDANEYKFEETEETRKTPRDENAMKELRSAFHAADIHPHQAAKLLPLLEKFASTIGAGKRDADDAAFEEAITKQYGNETETKLKNIKQLIGESIPAEHLPRLSRMSNDGLLLMSLMYDNFYNKYVKEDSTHGQGNGPGGSSSDIAALRKRGDELIAHPAYDNTFHAEHEAIRKESSEVYQKIAGLESLSKDIKKS